MKKSWVLRGSVNGSCAPKLRMDSSMSTSRGRRLTARILRLCNLPVKCRQSPRPSAHPGRGPANVHSEERANTIRHKANLNDDKQTSMTRPISKIPNKAQLAKPGFDCGPGNVQWLAAISSQSKAKCSQATGDWDSVRTQDVYQCKWQPWLTLRKPSSTCQCNRCFRATSREHEQ